MFISLSVRQISSKSPQKARFLTRLCWEIYNRLCHSDSSFK